MLSLPFCENSAGRLPVLLLEGRWVEAAETVALLEPYEEWAGLASVYLLAGFARGLLPLPDGSRMRPTPGRLRFAAA